jgi:hypothetical protein
MTKYEYDDKNYYGELDDVVFQSERLIEKISAKKYLDMTDRELVRNAIELCVKLRSNPIKRIGSV